MIFEDVDYQEGARYSLDQLPSQTRMDAAQHFVNDPEHGADQDDADQLAARATYIFRMLKPVEVWSSMYDLDLEDADIRAMMRDPYVVELAKDIKNGLRFPAVGWEGRSRGLAHLRLKRDLPYFDVVSP